MFNDSNEQMPKVILVNQSKIVTALISVVNIIKRYKSNLTLAIVITSYIIFTSFVCWKAYDTGFEKGLHEGSRTTWNQQAQLKTTMPLNDFLDHYTLEYRLSGILDSIDDKTITITKGNTTKSFNRGFNNFILGDKNLSFEDNMFATPSSKIKYQDIKEVLQPGDEITLVSRIYTIDQEPVITQIIKYK